MSVQILVLLAKTELNSVTWKSFNIISIWLRDRIMLMSFIFLLNLQRALLPQTFWCFVGIFNSRSAATYRAIFWENCNLTLKLGQDSSQTEAAWPEHLLRFLTGTRFLSEWLQRGPTEAVLAACCAGPFTCLTTTLKWLPSSCSDTAVWLLETLHLTSCWLRMCALVVPRCFQVEPTVHKGTERRGNGICRIFEITKTAH